MANADASLPNFKTYAEGEPIPPVDPEDLKSRWNIKPPWTAEALQAAWSHEADSSAVSRRDGMIRTLTRYNQGQLLTPWHRGEELDDAVFRVAATFPIREQSHKRYMIPGDEYFGFDPNAFVQRLIEETGISHVWEQIAIKVPEGGRGYTTVSATFKGQRTPNHEREAKYQARELLWQIWSRFANLGDLMPLRDKWTVSRTSELFDNFVKANDDLFREVESGLRTRKGVPLAILTEVERRAEGRV
jgi:hypothetical protein